jgi:hypothetical protein
MHFVLVPNEANYDECAVEQPQTGTIDEVEAGGIYDRGNDAAFIQVRSAGAGPANVSQLWNVLNTVVESVEFR